ncbi:hypothetical protein SLEP1_g34533 [Rubroshorea leprosula]|uniref:Uncharacterized protein n=1 Tax=Rubroshorea leprosula TaxID=152421 RepID=A0AAV5KK89_9ROSI|nr:hypothetical protein SLEP1_g34533 [Rubroshorea leprosula]
MMARACRGIIAGSGAQQGKQSVGDLGCVQGRCRLVRAEGGCLVRV